MTEPLSPDDALVLSYVDGTLNDGDRAAFDARLRAEPALRAEVEGLVAVRALLVDDARYGQSAGLDVPPAHLVDAIVRAEVAARPDAIRAAVLRAADDAAASRPWWSKLSSWLVGGSLVGAGAAALLLVVNRADAPAAPAMFKGSQAEAAAAVAPPPPPPPASASAAGMAGLAPAAEPGAQANAVAPAAVAPVGAPDEGAADDKAPPEPRRSAKAAAANDALADMRPAVVESARGGDVRASTGGGGGAVASKADIVGDVSSPASAAPSPAPATPASAPASAPPAESEQRPAIPRSREEFLEKKRAAEESASKAKSAGDGPAALRAELDRARRVQGANELLLAAEHELSIGRADNALEFAQRAELDDRAGALGALPVATQVRAYAALKRNVDAARVASRLLQASPAEPAVVDALVVGADAAAAIGDRGLARRLLQRALEPANHDAARRATARQRLEQLGAGEAAKAKAESSPSPR